MAFHRRHLVDPSGTIFSIHQNQVLQGCPLCGLCVSSYCSRAIITVSVPTAITVIGVDPEVGWLLGPAVTTLDNLVCRSFPFGVGAALEEI